MNVMFKQPLNDEHLLNVLRLKNVINAGFVHLSKNDYDDMDEFDITFMLEHEMAIRDKSKIEMENKSKLNNVSKSKPIFKI